MAHLVKIHQVRYIDRDGQRVPKGTPGARRVREKSSKWYGCGISGQGKKRVPLATAKDAAQRMLNEMVKGAERGEAKMIDRDSAARLLKDHLKDFETDLAAGLRVGTSRKRRTAPTPRQVALVVQRVRDVLDGCGFRHVDDLKVGASKLARWLTGRVDKPRAEGGASAQTATFLLAEARRFVRWIARKGTGVSPDAFDSVAGFDPSNDRKHARRDVSPEELRKVLEAAKESKHVYRTLTGEDRYHLYLTAFATGFRAGELASLTPAHFHLADEPPSVSLPGKNAKNKKTVRPPIPPAVAIALRSYFAGKTAGQPIWPGEWKRHGAYMLRIDLRAAKVPYVVETPHGKEHADFHALRHTFLSSLAAAGIGAKELQTLARHSDPRLTLGVYTHARSAELVKAVGRLKVPGATESPLASLDREQLEQITFGLLLMLGTVLSPTVDSRVALRVAPASGIAGDSVGQVGTKRRAALGA